MVSTARITLYCVCDGSSGIELLCFCVLLDCRLVHTSQRGRLRTHRTTMHWEHVSAGQNILLFFGLAPPTPPLPF